MNNNYNSSQFPYVEKNMSTQGSPLYQQTVTYNGNQYPNVVGVMPQTNIDPLKKTAVDQGEAIKMLCENNQALVFQNAALSNDNVKLQRKLEKLPEAKDLCQEELVQKGTQTLYIKYNEESIKTVIFSDFIIEEVIKMNGNKKLKKEPYYLIKTTNDKIVNIPLKDFKPKTVVKLFLEAGLNYKLKMPQNRVGELLMGHISSLIGTEKYLEFTIYGTSGWHGTKNKYCFPSKDIAVDEDTPLYKSEFITTNTNEPINSIERGLGVYNYLKKEEDKLVFLAVLLSSLLYTRLKKMRYPLKQILLLSGDNVTIENIAKLYLKIFDKHSPFISLNCKTRQLNKALLYTEDSTLVIDGRVSNLSDYLPKNNLEHLIQLLCKNGCITSDDLDEEYSANLGLILLDEEIGYRISKKYFIGIDITSKDIEQGVLDLTSYYQYWGDMIYYFIKYMEMHVVNLKNHIDEKPNVPDIYKNTYITFCIVIDLFIDFLREYKLDLYKLLALSRDYRKTLRVYFITQNSDDYKSISLHFEQVLQDLISKDKLNVVYDNKLNSFNCLNNTIFIVQNEVYFTEKCLKNKILPHIKLRISVRKLLVSLHKSGMLIFNKDGFRTKRSVYINDKPEFKGFVILKKDMLQVLINGKGNNMKKEKTADEERRKFYDWIKL